jgi:hypothetical protein
MRATRYCYYLLSSKSRLAAGLGVSCRTEFAQRRVVSEWSTRVFCGRGRRARGVGQSIFVAGGAEDTPQPAAISTSPRTLLDTDILSVSSRPRP